LELTYNTPVYITGVDTFETLDVKSVTSMEACKSDGTWVPLWKLCGEPKVYPTYGDVKGAWAPASSSGSIETLQLK